MEHEGGFQANGNGGGGGCKTLYVGNLDNSVTEELILALFGQIGPVKGCKIIREAGGSDPYCFVEFTHHQAASHALTAMNRRRCMEKEMKVNWATNPCTNGPSFPSGKVDTSQHHHIFVGDLSPEIDTDTLRNAFTPFGEISDCRVVKDMTTNRSKGYGFCSFVKKTDAQTAIDTMNGQWLGSRSIRTNWATRKPPAPHNGFSSMGDKNKLDYDDMFNRSSATNFTVYCGGISDSDENSIRRVFSQYGRIMEIRYFKDKGYAFVRYDNKESACSAIVAVHCTDIDGQNVKCSWGKENPGSSNPGSNMPNPGMPNSSNSPNGALSSRLGMPGQNPGTGAVMMPGANPNAPGGYQGGVSWDPQQLQAAQLAAAAAQNPAAAQQYYAQQQQYYAYMYNPQYMQQMQQQAAAQQQYYAQQQGQPGYSQNSSNQGGQPPYPGGYGPPQSH